MTIITITNDRGHCHDDDDANYLKSVENIACVSTITGEPGPDPENLSLQKKTIHAAPGHEPGD